MKTLIIQSYGRARFIIAGLLLAIVLINSAKAASSVDATIGFEGKHGTKQEIAKMFERAVSIHTEIYLSDPNTAADFIYQIHVIELKSGGVYTGEYIVNINYATTDLLFFDLVNKGIDGNTAAKLANEHYEFRGCDLGYAPAFETLEKIIGNSVSISITEVQNMQAVATAVPESAPKDNKQPKKSVY